MNPAKQEDKKATSENTINISMKIMRLHAMIGERDEIINSLRDQNAMLQQKLIKMGTDLGQANDRLAEKEKEIQALKVGTKNPEPSNVG